MTRARIEGDEIVIRIPFHLLEQPHIVPQELLDPTGRPTVRVTSPAAFAGSVVDALNAPDEIGDTKVYDMLVAGFMHAVEDGAEGIVTIPGVETTREEARRRRRDEELLFRDAMTTNMTQDVATQVEPYGPENLEAMRVRYHGLPAAMNLGTVTGTDGEPQLRFRGLLNETVVGVDLAADMVAADDETRQWREFNNRPFTAAAIRNMVANLGTMNLGTEVTLEAAAADVERERIRRNVDRAFGINEISPQAALEPHAAETAAGAVVELTRQHLYGRPTTLDRTVVDPNPRQCWVTLGLLSGELFRYTEQEIWDAYRAKVRDHGTSETLDIARTECLRRSGYRE